MVDCPSTEFVPGVVENVSFPTTLESKDANLVKVFHFLGRGVIDDSRYLDWMRSFPETVEVSPSLEGNKDPFK